MDFLNKAFAQLSDLFGSMTPGARITAGLLLAAVVTSFGWLLNHQVGRGDSYLMEGQVFSSAELNAMEAAFGQANLGGYEVDSGRMRVPSGQKAKYMAALVDHEALPAQFASHLTAAINKPGPFTGRVQQEAMLKVALQKELSEVIRWMAGIEKAAVLYDTQKKPGLGQQRVTTASVTIKPVGQRALDESQVPKIRDLVASAIGTTGDQVTVVDCNSSKRYAGGGSHGVGDLSDDPYFARMQQYRLEFEGNVRQALAYVPGVQVTASVELDRQIKHQEERNHVDTKPVALTVREESTSDTTDTSPPAGRPGVEGQQRPNTSAQLTSTAKGSHSEQEHTMSEEQRMVSTDRTTTELAPLTPKRVTVTVSVPRSYYLKVWQELNTTDGAAPTQPDKKALDQIEVDEKTRIQNHVATLIPQPDATADNRPLVTVTTFTDIPEPPIASTPATAQAWNWFSAHWSTLGIFGLGLFSLLIVRSLSRGSPTTSESPSLGLDLAAATPSPAEPTVDGKPTDKKSKPRLSRRATGPTLRDELVEIVREDPDAAANVLRGWIGGTN